MSRPTNRKLLPREAMWFFVAAPPALALLFDPRVCGALEIFDLERGCIRSPACDVRELGEPCEDTGRCNGGNVCCAIGGASTASTCQAPLCDDPSGVCGPALP